MRFVVARTRNKHGTTALIGGIGIGAALMYYLDPARGARRRGLLRDRLTHAANVAGDAIGSTSRDIATRARGFAEARALGDATDSAATDSDDRVLEARVRAQLGRVVSQPAAIDVMADQDGRVTLAGEVLGSEVDRLVRRVSRMRGVNEVNNRLRVFESDEGVPALQGGESSTDDEFELQQDTWSPAVRFLTSIAGGAMALYGIARRDRLGSVMGAAGLALLSRGVSSRELGGSGRTRGRRAGIEIRKTVTIAAPVDEVFAFLTDWEKFPHWMTHVRAVRSSGPHGEVGERTHWEVDGPAGSTVEWDAVTTRFVPNELVAWKSVEGEPIRQTGRMRFSATDDGGTRVQIDLQYNPPGGAVGHAIAALFKRDPKHQLDDDLARLKAVIETGHVPREAAAPIATHVEPTAEKARANGPRRRAARVVRDSDEEPDVPPATD